jgi:hypothetical protein
MQWTYRQHTPLSMRGSLEGSQLMLSQSGEQQGDPCGMLVFCLALQIPRNQSQEVHPATRMLTYAHDCHLQRRSLRVIAAFNTLCDLASTIDLEMQLPKNCPYGWDGAALAQGLGQDDFLACGMMLRTPTLVAFFVEQRADHACRLTDTLLVLPLALQDKHLLLRSSLQPRMTHLLRTVYWVPLEASLKPGAPHSQQARRRCLLHHALTACPGMLQGETA